MGATTARSGAELNPRAVAQAVVAGLLSAGPARSVLAQGFGDAALNAADSPEARAETAAWLLGLSTQTRGRAVLFEHKNPQSRIPERVGLAWAAIAAPSWKTGEGAQALQRACVRPFPKLVDFMRGELGSWSDKDRVRLARRLLSISGFFSEIAATGEGMEPVLKTLASTPGKEREAIELLSRHWHGADRGAGWQFAWLADEALAAKPAERLQMLRVGFMAWPLFVLKNQYGVDDFAWSEVLADPEMGANWAPERWIDAARDGEKAYDAFFEANGWEEEGGEAGEDGASSLTFGHSATNESEMDGEGSCDLDDLAWSAAPLDKSLRSQLANTGTFDGFGRMRAPSALWRAARAEPDFWSAAFWGEKPEKPMQDSAHAVREQLPFALDSATRWSQFLSMALMNGRGWPLERLSEWKPEGQSAQLPLDCWAGIAKKDWRGAGASANAMERAGRSWGMAPARGGSAEGGAGAVATLAWDLAPELASTLRRALNMAAAAEGPWAGWRATAKGRDLANALLRAARGEEDETARFTEHPDSLLGLSEGVMALGRHGFDFDRPVNAKKETFASLWVAAVESRFENTRISAHLRRAEIDFWQEWAPKMIEAAKLEGVVAAADTKSGSAAKKSKKMASEVDFPANKTTAGQVGPAKTKTRRI